MMQTIAVLGVVISLILRTGAIPAHPTKVVFNQPIQTTLPMLFRAQEKSILVIHQKAGYGF